MNREKLIDQMHRCITYDCVLCEYSSDHGCKDHVMKAAMDMLEHDGRQISQMEARLAVGPKPKGELPDELIERMTISLSITELRELLKEGKVC